MSSAKQNTKRQKWSLDNIRINRVSSEALASPPAYSASTGQNASIEVSKKKTDVNRLISKKSWDLALGPIKQVPMNCLISYMSGNSISLFPIMMVGMMLMRSMQAIWTTKSTFKMSEAGGALDHMAVYVLGNALNIGLALYKCQTMGLLPTHSSDWLAFVEPPIRQEYLGGGIALN